MPTSGTEITLVENPTDAALRDGASAIAALKEIAQWNPDLELSHDAVDAIFRMRRDLAVTCTLIARRTTQPKVSMNRSHSLAALRRWFPAFDSWPTTSRARAADLVPDVPPGSPNDLDLPSARAWVTIMEIAQGASR